MYICVCEREYLFGVGAGSSLSTKRQEKEDLWGQVYISMYQTYNYIGSPFMSREDILVAMCTEILELHESS